MARKYTKTSLVNLDASNTAFPSEVKKVMLGSMPTGSEMYIAGDVDCLEGADMMTRGNIAGLSKNKRNGILGKTGK